MSPLHSSPAIVLGGRVTGPVFIEAASPLSSLAASQRDQELELSRMQWSAAIGLVISCLAATLAIPGQGQRCVSKKSKVLPVLHRSSGDSMCGGSLDLKTYLFMNKVCEDCFALYRDDDVYSACRSCR